MDLGGIVIEVADDTNWEGSVVTTINVNNNHKINNAGNAIRQVQNIQRTNVVHNEVIQESEKFVGQVLEYEVPGVAGAVNVQYGIESENPSDNVQYVQHVPYDYEPNNYNVDTLVNKIGTNNQLTYSNNVQNIDQNITYSLQNNSNNHQNHEVPMEQDTNCQVQYVVCSENNNALDNVSYLENGTIANSKKEKIHQCPHCDYKTEVPRSLTIHIRRHTGEKPYLCDKCGDSFTNPSDLLRHKIRHTNQREYLCGQCDAAFKDVAGINKHVKTMHFLGQGDISHYRFKEETSDWGEKILFIKVVKDSQHFVRRFKIVKS